MGSIRSLAAAFWAGLLLLPGGAQANDTSAVLGAGGLILARNLEVEMKSEDLFVSMREIRVAYRFKASGDKPVTTLVAFPLPDLVGGGVAQGPVTLPIPDAANFVGFKTVVDGTPVAVQTEQRVFAVGIDRTELLKSLGVPLDPLGKATQDALDKVPRDKWDQLVDLGLVQRDEFDAGKGVENHLAPTWTLKTIFYWQQTFPPGREVKVEHSYRPVVGYSVGNVFANPDYAKEDWHKKDVATFCTDRSFVESVRKAHKQSPEARIEYILTTGANWAGPIEDFRLVIDKGDPTNLVSFCADGVTKISPTQFEVRKKNYRPERELNVVIVGKKVEP